jgi:hypothetical protein
MTKITHQQKIILYRVKPAVLQIKSVKRQFDRRIWQAPGKIACGRTHDTPYKPFFDKYDTPYKHTRILLLLSSDMAMIVIFGTCQLGGAPQDREGSTK